LVPSGILGEVAFSFVFFKCRGFFQRFGLASGFAVERHAHEALEARVDPQCASASWLAERRTAKRRRIPRRPISELKEPCKES
jgi:hypothetical protein